MTRRTRFVWANEPHKAWRWAGGLMLVLAVGAGSVSLVSRSRPNTSRPSSDLRPLPAFLLRGFDGGKVSNAALAERPAVINFFASTCVFCIQEMPAFERIHARLGDRVKFLGVALRDGEQAARDLARETGVTYQLAFDDSGSFYRVLRAIGMPVTVFVRDDGRIASVHLGPLSEPLLMEQIESLLGVAA